MLRVISNFSFIGFLLASSLWEERFNQADWSRSSRFPLAIILKHDFAKWKRGCLYMSRTSRSLLQPQQQIMTLELEACSSSLSTESWCSGIPEMTRVSQAPQMPSSQE